jgi:hypothetical protein
MTSVRCGSGLILTCVTALALPAQAHHPDFSGTWQLDTARSTPSSFTPKRATYVVHQYADSMVVDRETSGTGKVHTVYALDGAPRTNALRLIGLEVPATSHVSWAHDTMVVRTESRPDDKDLVQVDRWVVAGAMFYMLRSASYDGAPMDSPTLVFARQP